MARGALRPTVILTSALDLFLALEGALDVELLEALVRVVDEQLLEAICLEHLRHQRKKHCSEARRRSCYYNGRLDVAQPRLI